MAKSKPKPKAAVYCAHDEMVPIDKMVEHPRNPNQHPDTQIELLAKIIVAQGWRNAIVVSKLSGFITKGHGRLQAARKAGLPDVPVDYQDYENEAAEHADMIADNRIAELAEMDNTGLKDLLEDLDVGDFDMELTGFDEKALEDLMTAVMPPPVIVEDDPPEVQKDAITELGRIYQLGNHRLMCGDGTDKSDVERLLASDKPGLMVTDPEWKDDKCDCRKAWALFKGEAAYVWHAGLQAHTVAEGLIVSGFGIKSQIIWVKSNFVIGMSHYHWKHEPCWYVVRDGATAGWEGDRKQTTVWDIQKQPKSDSEEKPQKPVECMARPILNNSTIGALVYDPFGRSGTTLIACEQLDRGCRMMELDPRYCDVIVRRYAKLVKADADEIFETGVHS